MPNVLDLKTLATNYHPGLTPAMGTVFAECASVCFEHNSHGNGTLLRSKGISDAEFEVNGIEVTSQMRNCHADEEVAVENAAYGISILLMGYCLNVTVIEKSRKGTGFDYWMGNGSAPYLQNKVRLEVSGLRNGSVARREARKKLKLKQVERMNSPLPAYVSIVDFGPPVVEVEKK